MIVEPIDLKMIGAKLKVRTEQRRSHDTNFYRRMATIKTFSIWKAT